jgi:hypothetical protein
MLTLSATAQEKLDKPKAEEDPKLDRPREEPGPKLEQPKNRRGPKLRFSDGKYPLWELRPLDRRVYCISLDGAWRRPAESGASYRLVIRFPNGKTYTHRPINDELFFKGEMRFLVQEYMLVRSGAVKGGELELYVTERLTAGARAEKISNTMEVPWPLCRPIARRAPAIKATPPRPIDEFPLPEKLPED